MTEAIKDCSLIIKLQDDIKAGHDKVLEEFWKSAQKIQTPIIEDIAEDKENMLVTVLWRDKGDIQRMSVIGEFFGFDPEESRLSKIENTDVWYRSFVCPSDVRSLYLFILNDREEQDWSEADMRVDVLNPKKYVCPLDEERPGECTLLREVESLLELPKAREKKYINEPAENAKGKVELYRFESKSLGNSRRVWVYTPADYESTKIYGLAVFMDGWEYINIIKAPNILDNLAAENLIPPICAVFIESTKDRSSEYACNRAYTEFLTEEILPWIRENYSIDNAAEKTIAAGFSFGALAASYAALIHPECFGKVLGQSGGFAWKPEGEEEGWIIREFEKSPKLPIDFYLDIGSFELKWDFVAKAIKGMTEVLSSKGYNYIFNTFTGGHVHTDWQDTLPDALIYLIGNR